MSHSSSTLLGVWLCLAAIITTAFLRVADGYYCEESEPRPGCDPDSTDPATSGCFDASRTRTVFGINIWAPADVPLWAVTYTESVLAEFLDSDEDGNADDPNLLDALLNSGDGLDTAVLNCRGSIGRGPLKDLFWSITRTYGQPTLEDGDDVGWNEWKRITMEETHHAIHRGLENAYEDVFGNGLTSDLSLAIDQAYDDCEYPAECAPYCQNYECTCPNNDNNGCNEPHDYDCSWIEDSCNGVYHYSHVLGCDFDREGGGCQGSEGLYWASTTLLGWQKGGFHGGEWEISTAEELATNDKTKLFYDLVSGQAPSQDQYGYRVPSRLPDGRYKSDAPGRLACDLFFEKSGCKAVGNCRWNTVPNGLSRCVDGDPSGDPSGNPSGDPSGDPSRQPSDSGNTCVNTEFLMIPNEVTLKEKRCTGLLNQLFAPPTDVDKLQEVCNQRYKSTDPNNDTVLVSEACPTFCNFDTCCSVDKQFEFLVDGKKKKCGGLLNKLVEDKTEKGKAALAEQCAAELQAVTGGTVAVEDVCTGLCRKGCEVVKCVNKRDDQFVLIPDDDNTDNRLDCDQFLKNKSKKEKKMLCRKKISIYNVDKEKILKKKQTPKKTCPLYCKNRCKKQLALEESNSISVSPSTGPTTGPTPTNIPATLCDTRLACLDCIKHGCYFGQGGNVGAASKSCKVEKFIDKDSGQKLLCNEFKKVCGINDGVCNGFSSGEECATAIENDCCDGNCSNN